jgi:selenocysteine lyase/cysteine desulfurase
MEAATLARGSLSRGPVTAAGERAAFAVFRSRYPEWASTHAIDRLRASDYARLDAQRQVYLDYTGGGLYGESQLAAHHALLRASVLGNPHSESPTSLASTELAERARAAVLAFFGAAAEEYAVVFTANATGAIKLVAEAFPFAPAGRLLLTSDNHNSVNGIREYARAAGATTASVRTLAPSLRVDEDELERRLSEAATSSTLQRGVTSSAWVMMPTTEGCEIVCPQLIGSALSA